MKKTLAAAILGVALLAGCGEREAPYIFGKGGKGKDVWLYGGVISSSKLALIFGYSDDMDGCLDLVKAYQILYPENDNYFCSYAGDE